jgi:hypothetical protein
MEEEIIKNKKEGTNGSTTLRGYVRSAQRGSFGFWKRMLK